MTEIGNIFLHFLKPDNLELFAQIIGKKDTFFYEKRKIEDSLRYAILLTKDYCILPPAFIIESQHNLVLLQQYKQLFNEYLLRFAIREESFDLYAEKKERQYSNLKTLNSKFENYQLHEIYRLTEDLDFCLEYKDLPIGKTSAKLWFNDINNLESGEFSFLKNLYNEDPYNIKKVVNVLNFNIQELNETAFVWEFVTEKLKKVNFSNKSALFQLHCALQNYYIRSNIDNGNWKLLCNSPLFKADFGIRYMGLRYDYEAFNIYVNNLGLGEIIKYSDVSQLIKIRQNEGFYNFMLMFDFLTKISDDISTLKNNYNKFLYSNEKPNLNIFKLLINKVLDSKCKFKLFHENSSFCVENFYNKVNEKFDIFIKQTSVENQEDFNDKTKIEFVKNYVFLEAHAHPGSNIIISNTIENLESNSENKSIKIFKEKKMDVQIHANQGSQVNVAQSIEKIEFVSITNSQISETDFKSLKNLLLKLETSELSSLEEEIKSMQNKSDTSNNLNSLKVKVDDFFTKHALPISHSLTATVIYEGLKILFGL